MNPQRMRTLVEEVLLANSFPNERLSLRDDPLPKSNRHLIRNFSMCHAVGRANDVLGEDFSGSSRDCDYN